MRASRALQRLARGSDFSTAALPVDKGCARPTLLMHASSSNAAHFWYTTCLAQAMAADGLQHWMHCALSELALQRLCNRLKFLTRNVKQNTDLEGCAHARARWAACCTASGSGSAQKWYGTPVTPRSVVLPEATLLPGSASVSPAPLRVRRQVGGGAQGDGSAQQDPGGQGGGARGRDGGCAPCTEPQRQTDSAPMHLLTLPARLPTLPACLCCKRVRAPGRGFGKRVCVQLLCCVALLAPDLS